MTTACASTVERLLGGDAFGLYENEWSHISPPGTGLIPGITNHTRDEYGWVRERLLDQESARTAAAYIGWAHRTRESAHSLNLHGEPSLSHGYANVIREELPEPISVLVALSRVARRADR